MESACFATALSSGTSVTVCDRARRCGVGVCAGDCVGVVVDLCGVVGVRLRRLLRFGVVCGGFGGGMVVDGVSDVISLNESQIKDAPEFGAVLDTQYIRGLGVVDERMLILIDIENLMTSKEMALVEALA